MAVDGQLWRQYVIAGLVNISIVCTGYAMGWTSPVLPKLDDEATSPLPEPITSNESAWIGSLLTIGAIFGPFIAGFLAARVGRKWGLLASTLPLFVGWILIAAATNVALIYAGRIFWGIAVGMLFTLSPMYCSEIATVERRGALGSFLQVFLSLGFVTAYSTGPYVSYSAVTYIGVAIAAVFAVIVFFMPESPIYLLTKNNIEGAKDSLAFIRGKSREGVESELNEMAAGVKASMSNSAKFTDIFRGNNFKALYLSCILIFFQQFSGINAVLFYMSTIFRASGSALDAAVATIVTGAVQLVASCMTPLVVDRLGRKILLLISSAGTAIGLTLLGTYFYLEENGNPIVDNMSVVPILSLILYTVTHCWGLGSIPWAVMSELFPIEVKAVSASIATTLVWVLSFFVTRYFEPVADAVGMYTAFWIFGGCCVMSFVFVLLCLPETKGKSFQQIQDMLAGRPSSKIEKA